MPAVRPRTTLYLWEFLLQLLDGKESCPAISWVNREKGEFVLKDQGEIAKLWGKVKGRPRMDKIKLGRAMRYYYKKKLLAKVPRRKAVYRFVKFSLLEQKDRQAEHEEIPEIDFSDSRILDLIEEENFEDSGRPVQGLNLEEEDDMPLESLLVDDKRQGVFPHQKCPKLFPMETNVMQNRESGNSCHRFMDFSSTNVNTSNLCRENDRIKPDGFEVNDYASSSPSCSSSETDSVHCSNYDDSSHFASLLVKSILIGEQQAMGESTGLRTSCSYEQTSCRWSDENFNPVLASEQANVSVKNNEAVMQPPVIPPCYMPENDRDTTWNTIKEIERMLLFSRDS